MENEIPTWIMQVYLWALVFDVSARNISLDKLVVTELGIIHPSNVIKDEYPTIQEYIDNLQKNRQ